MSYQRALDAGKKLAQLGDSSIKSIDSSTTFSRSDFLQMMGLGAVADNAVGSVQKYLGFLKTGKGSPEALISLCEVKLRLVLAKVRMVQKGSSRAPKGLLGKELAQLADAQLPVGEERYGSGDAYVEGATLDKLVDYGIERIKTYLECVKSGKGNPDILLGDCENHLRFVLAKVEMLKKEEEEAQKAADLQGIAYP